MGMIFFLLHIISNSARSQQEIVKFCAVYHDPFMRNETLKVTWSFSRNGQDFCYEKKIFILLKCSFPNIEAFPQKYASFMVRFLGNVVDIVALTSSFVITQLGIQLPKRR